MIPATYNLVIVQGDTFSLKQTYSVKATSTSTAVPVNLTNCTISASIRKEKSKTSTLLGTFTCPITDAVNGKYEMNLTASESAALNFDVAYYDMQITFSDGTKRTMIQGRVVLNKEVTNV